MELSEISLNYAYITHFSLVDAQVIQGYIPYNRLHEICVYRNFAQHHDHWEWEPC